MSSFLIVTDSPLPEEVKLSLSAWAGCVAGAVKAKDYIGMMEAVSFTNVTVTPVFFDKETADSAFDDLKLNMIDHPLEDVYEAVYSTKITAYKPAYMHITIISEMIITYNFKVTETYFRHFSLNLL